MALIDCPECGHEVSDKADACPSCGLRLTEQLNSPELQLEAELNRIDLEWERYHRKFMSSFKEGGRPPKGEVEGLVGLVVLGTICMAFGIWIIGFALGIWIVPEGRDERGAMVFLTALSFVLFFAGLWGYHQDLEYLRAEAEYRGRRETVTAKYGGLGEGKTSGSVED